MFQNRSNTISFQSSLIILSVLISFCFTLPQLKPFSSQIIALIIFFHLLTIYKKSPFPPHLKPLIQTTTLIIVATLLVFSTGGLTSPLFFILYFIPFAVALVFHPGTVFVLGSSILGFFLLQGPQQTLVSNFPLLASLLFLSPIAYFFGLQFQKKKDLNTQEMAEKIDSDVEKIVINQKDTLTNESVEELADIVKETKKIKENS